MATALTGLLKKFEVVEIESTGFDDGEWEDINHKVSFSQEADEVRCYTAKPRGGSFASLKGSTKKFRCELDEKVKELAKFSSATEAKSFSEREALFYQRDPRKISSIAAYLRAQAHGDIPEEEFDLKEGPFYASHDGTLKLNIDKGLRDLYSTYILKLLKRSC